MDIASATKAHNDWKLRLLNYSRGTAGEKLDLQALGKDNLCMLGRWLHGEGLKHKSDGRFQKLTEIHAAFHASAASIGELVARGQSAAAEAQLNSVGSEFNRLSFRLLAFLRDLEARNLLD
ncbi:MAG TPA: CZB domain-containing protein [Bryobacteraceae bacterium]|nr:CZB domain-containing protein [Bryobacteraceae bacterium]